MNENKDCVKLPPNYRWNFATFLVDYVCFGTALSFASPSSVMPAFVGQLTTLKPVIGLVNTTFRGGWMLPQLVVARLIGDKPRKKPYMLVGLVGRVAFWVIALALGAGLARHPATMLVLFFVCLGFFAVGDGISSVSWFDILARAIPPKRRGRLIGTAQFIIGLAGIGVGALVTLIVARCPFPNDYRLLFALAGFALVPSAIAMLLLREPAPEEVISSQANEQVKSSWLQPLTDPAFRRLMMCRILVGMIGLADSFYVAHAGDVLRLPQSVIGSFVGAQTLAGLIASLLLGLVCERWGSRYVIRIGSAVAAAGPLFALVAQLTGGAWLIWAYPFVFVSLGVLNNAFMMGFLNYLLEIAPEGMRPAYMGLGNTIMGLLTLAPMAGGQLLKVTSDSYATLFGLTATLVTVGFVFTLRLRPPRQTAPAEG